MKQKDEKHLNCAEEKQSEFFSEFQTAEAKKSDLPFRKNMAAGKRVALNLSYENIVLVFIGFIMLAVIFFSLGVEKGKRADGQKKEDRITSEAIKEGIKSEIAKNDKIVEKKAAPVTLVAPAAPGPGPGRGCQCARCGAHVSVRCP